MNQERMTLMVNLTNQQKKILNNLSKALDNGVSLGDIIQGLITASCTSGTPINAVAAHGTLTLTGVVVDGETVTIGDDVYEFVTDDAQSVVAGHIPVDIKDRTTAANGTLTLAAQPTAGDTFTIGAVTYIFVPVGTATGPCEVSIGADLAAAKLNLVAAINGTDGINDPHLLVSAGEFVVNACAITALKGGTIGNSIATTETFTSGLNVFAAGTLGSGADCTAANAILDLITAITANDTMGVSAVDGDGDTIVITADVAGIAGNNIATTETMANGSFGAVKLAGGVNGTTSVGINFMIDETNLYICTAENGIHDANWKKITLSSL